MDQDLLCAAAAAARAAVHLQDPLGDVAEPPHPAFAGFRRCTYLWQEGAATYPVGDTLQLWLAFLDERGARSARLAVDAAGPLVVVATDGGADAWRPATVEGLTVMRGVADAAAGDAPGLRDAEERLRAALAPALRQAGRLPRLQGEAVRRATAILDSAADGSEVSDVAWPFFVLTPRHSDAARRLLAAAAALWPGELQLGGGEELVPRDVVQTALVAAVNSLPGRPAARPAERPVK